MVKSFKIITLGCKTNQYESRAIGEMLERTGKFRESPGEDADLYVVNTCTVTAKADKESRTAVRRCARRNPAADVVVTGCSVERGGGRFSGLPGVSRVVRNREKDLLAEILAGEPPRRRPRGDNAFTPLRLEGFGQRDRAFLKVQEGCDNLCSYCAIPLARGRSRSRGEGDILEETARLAVNGYKEIVITGICLGDWGRSLPGSQRLHTLLEKIDRMPGDFRVRLSSIEPRMVTEEMIEVMAYSRRICPHLHIPLQSGSDRVLRAMNRPYRGVDFIKIIKRAKRSVKEMAFTSDVMIGFPGESEDDFKATVDTVEASEPSRLHIFTFSGREGTAAAAMDGKIGRAISDRRRSALKSAAERLSYGYRSRFKGRKVYGLVENRRDPETGLLTGYTERYIRFLADGPDLSKGKIVPMKITNLDKKSTFCDFLQ